MRWLVGGGAIALALVAGACSADATDAGSPATTSTTTTSSSAPAPSPSSTTSATTTTTSEPWPTELDSGWEQAWAADRQAVIDRLTDGIERGDWGVGDDHVLRGPGNLEIDLDECPPDWDPTEGVTDDEIVLGAAAWFGGLAGYTWFPGAQTYIAEVNAAGGIDGRQVRLRGYEYLGDESHMPYVLEQLDVDRPFSISGRTLIGDLRAEALRRCIPAPASEAARIRGATPRWSPFETFMVASERAEAQAWIELVRDSIEGPRVRALAVVGSDTAFSEQVVAAFDDAAVAAGLPVDLELAEHAALDYELPAAVWSRADAVDVVAIMTGGPMCGLVFDELGDAVHDLVGLAAGTCRHESSIDPARPGSSGWLSVSFDPRDLADVGGSYGARLRDSSRNSDGHPWLEGPNSKASYAWAWLQVELLRIASELPGGLNRPNLLLAMWSADLRPPHHQPGVRYQLDGFDDPEPIEPTVIERWDAERREWVPHP